MNPAEFYQSIKLLSGHDRETAILDALDTEDYQNIPEWMQPKELTFHGKDAQGQDHTVTLQVSPDYLGFGSGTDYFRVPMWPSTAQKLAQDHGFYLPTKKIVDLIYQGAGIKLPPKPIRQSYFLANHFSMTSPRAFWEHNQMVEAQLQALGNDRTKIIAGHKKDIVLTPKLKNHPGHVAIYGWHVRIKGKTDATRLPEFWYSKPIQGLNYTDHSNTYVDYSHGVRLIGETVVMDGVDYPIGDVLRHPILHVLLSDEGAFDFREVEMVYYNDSGIKL